MIGYLGQPIGFAIVAGVVITFMRELEAAQPPGFASAWRLMLDRFGRVVLGQLLASVIVFALALTIIALPIAIWKYVAWQFVQDLAGRKGVRIRL